MELWREIEDHVQQILNKQPGKIFWGIAVTHGAFPGFGRNSNSISIADGRKLWSANLPHKVPEKNLFPSERMLHYMGEAELPTKTAKPRDWIEIAEALAYKVLEDYRDQ